MSESGRHRKNRSAENLSIAYAQTVAGSLGGRFIVSDSMEDSLGIDGHFLFPEYDNTDLELEAKVQLKATYAGLQSKDNCLLYRIKQSQYRRYEYRLPASGRFCPFFILLLVIPKDIEYASWTDYTEDKLLLLATMYWTDRLVPEGVDNPNRNMIYFPVTNRVMRSTLLQDMILPWKERYVD